MADLTPAELLAALVVAARAAREAAPVLRPGEPVSFRRALRPPDVAR